MILEHLYDISSLSEIDNDSKSIIITEEQSITSIFSSDLNDRKIATQIFRNEMNKTLKTGDVVLVTNEDFTIKAYCLITIVCGQIVPYLLYFIDYNQGKEITRNFTKGDIDILSQYPMFAEDEQLVFFITQLNKVFSADAPSDNRKYFQTIKTYLDKGLWVGNIDSLYGSTKEIADKLNYRSIDEDANVLFEKDGQILAFYAYNVYGNYEDVRKAYCEIAMMKENESLIYNSFFGNLFLTDAGSGIVNRNLLKYEEDVNNFFKSKPIQKTEEEVISQTIENTEAKITASENSFLADMDKLFQEAEEKIEKEKKKKNIENFKIHAEISDEEKSLAIKETITKAEKKITVPVVNQTQKFNQEVKIKDAIFNSPQDTYPKDWDYVYSVGETSRRYNPTIGQKYDSLTDTFIQDISQTKGMSIEEWNAYFIAHPELSHLIDETIGHLGGLFLDKKDLMENGYLLYDPKNVRLVYRHEYIRGNVYKLIDELENVKDVVIKVYGEKFYDNQMEILKSSIPPMRSLSSGDSSSIPFIHPLDEVVVDYKVNTAAGITYKNDSNNKELKKYRKELEDMVVNKTIQPNEVNAMLDEFSAKVQTLPLTVFFVEWLKTKYGKIAEYGLSSYELVFELYFKGLSHPGYAKHLVAANLVTVPPGKKPVDVVSVSDYFEAKDNAKRFVNDMFQQFIADEITNEDKKQIEILWNKRYNGYYTPDYWKLPVFIRHSKYFKNRNNKRLLNLNETQIMGIKFATIENSSIMAHEVGYGKTLVAIGYISHCFETRQSSNFMIAIPKTLFDNKKWREEIYGNYDDKKGIYIIGATPVYNLIELGNCSTSSIYGGGKNSEYKTYSDDDIDKINNISRIFVEIGGRESDKKTSKSVGTATIPKNPYNYKLAVVNSNYAWSKIIDKILPGIDQALFNKSRGKDYDENKEIIDLLVNYDFNAPIVNQDGSTSPADKKWHIWNLGNQILKTRFKYQYLFKQIGYNNSIDVDATINADPKSEIARRFDLFKNSELPDKYKRDKDGKLILDKATGERKEKPFSEIYEDYLMFVFEDLHQYISTVIQRMVDFAIYEYGNWKFSTSDRNIVLITKDALQNIGFSSDEIDGVKAIVEEITKYKNEERLSDAVNYYVNTGNGGVQKFSRRPEKVLQKQLEEMMDKINLNMTEQGKRGKFFLSNLKIDGFILDEAHIAKKLFTNVKTDARVELELPNGDVVSVRTSSHDINGGTPPNTSLFVFAVCQYIRSLGNRKPLMLLTATPFSNQPTEIFSMLSIVGINQLRENGVSNIKNFFDLFLKETLKYDFNQNGEFIKRITVEDFRNKEMLINLIWSVIDIRREASLDKLEKAEKRFGDKPIKIAFPKLVSDTAVQTSNVSADDEDLILDECEQVGSVNTVAILNRVNNNTCSIVDQNSIQKKMFADIEKVVSREMNPKTNLEYTFDDICPNISIFKELESQEKKEKTRKKSIEEDEAETKNNILVTLRSLVNSNINEISNGYNFNTDQDFYYYIKNIIDPRDYYSKYPKFEDLKFDTLFFIKNSNLTDSISGMRQWEIFKKSAKAKSTTIKLGNNYYGGLLVEFISSEEMAKETIRQLSRNNEYGITFKALGISKAIALSPYFYSCNDLPYPTPENIVKYSPKIEYLVKAIKSVKDHHINEIPKLIEDRKKTLEDLMKIKTPTNLDLKQIEKLRVEIPQLEAAREVSGQVIYINNMRFKYYFKDKDGKVKVEDFNIAELIMQYLVDKGWYSKDEVVLVSSGTGDEKKEKYIKEFQQGKVKVLFGTPAIKEGVDLQNKATTLYVLTPDWNPTDMRQVEGRIWRRDNENKFIRVVYILLDQSIEVFIYSKLEEKANRLKKIMKERGTIDEFEEMSLNPNQTKVALASDPKKRADIITKLCKVILEEQKNKINKNRQELIQIDNTLSTIVDNIEIIKNNYYDPYYTEMPNILDKYYNFVIKDQAELFANKKDLFLNRFVNKYHEYIKGTLSGTYPIKSNDIVLKYAMGLIYASNNNNASNEKLRYPYWNFDMNEVYDIFNGLEIILNKREDILMEIENTSDNSFHIIKKEMVLRYSPESSDINLMRFLAVDNRIKNTNKFFFTSSIESFISAAGILYLMPENILDEFKIVMKVILDKMKSGNITKQEIVNELDNFIILAKEMYVDYVLNNPYFKLENFPPYQDAKSKRDELKNNLKVEDLDAADIIDKMKIIRNFWFDDLSPKLNSFVGLPIETKRDVIAGNNKIPLLTEILVKLDLVSDKAEELVKKRSEIYALFDPILQTISTFLDVSLNLKNTKGMTLSDIPKVLSDTQDKYDEIEAKMIKLEKIKEKLIEKFEKINNEKKNVTVDDIVKKFAETNEYLNYKLQ